MSVLRPKSGIYQIKAHMLANDSSDYPPIRIALNSNESAFGPCQSAIDAAKASTANLARYLENPVSLLAPLIAKRQGLEVDRIAIGNGSDDLLARLARVYLDPGCEMIRSCNGYLKTPNYAFANNAVPVSVADQAFTTSVDAILGAVTEKTRMVYMANPENPAGTYISGAEVRRLHQALPSNVVLVLDCAYEEYVDALDYEAGHLLAKESENVVVTRTFSKIYGLMRGWAYTLSCIIDKVKAILDFIRNFRAPKNWQPKVCGCAISIARCISILPARASVQLCFRPIRFHHYFAIRSRCCTTGSILRKCVPTLTPS